MGKYRILVTGTGSLIGQAIIKSIQKSSIKENLKLIGCDYFENTVGSYWCDKNYILPDLLKAEEVGNWKDSIYKIIKRENIDAVFIGVDFELLYFADMKSDIKEKYGCTVMVSDSRVIRIGNDKYLTYNFLKENGLNAPDTVLMDDWDGKDLNYPIIIKPRDGARSRGVELIKDTDTLLERQETLRGKGFVVQKAVGNMEAEYTCGLLYWDNEFKNSIVLKRILKDGNTAMAEYNENKEENIVEYIRRIGDKLLPFGSCNLQLRTDENGKPFLFEINPRFSGTTYMRALFGYNEVEYVISKAIGLEPVAMSPKSGKVYRYYEERLVGK